MNDAVLNIIIRARDEASKAVQGVQGTVQKLQPTFQRMALVGGAAFTGIAAGIGMALKQATSLGESVNAVNVVFGEGADIILAFGRNAATSVGLANSEFNQMATITGALLKDTGRPISEISEITVQLTKRAADMASVFNTDVSDAMSAINQAIRGETEAIRRYAGDVTDATLETFALSQGINKSAAEMTEQEKRLLRVQLIMEQTKDTAGDFTKTSGELANQQRIVSAQFKDIGTTIGNAFVPIVKDALTVVRPVIGQMAQWIRDNPELARNIILAAGAIAGLVAVLGALGLVLPPVITGISLLLSPVGLVVAAVAALAAGLIWAETQFGVVSKAVAFAKGMFDQLAGGISAAISWIGDRIEWFKNNWAQAIGFVIGFFATLPIMLPVYVVAAIVKIIQYLASVNWSAVFASIGRAFEGAMNWVKDAGKRAFNFLKSINWGEVVAGIGRGIGNAVVGLIEGALNGAISGIPGIGKIKLPRFDNGGVVPGPIGKPRLVVAHGGETIEPTHKPGYRGSAGVTFNQYNTINNQMDMNAAMEHAGYLLGMRI